jgi:hypothetical protein
MKLYYFFDRMLATASLAVWPEIGLAHGAAVGREAAVTDLAGEGVSPGLSRTLTRQVLAKQRRQTRNWGALLDTDIAACNTCNVRISIIRSARLSMNRRCALQETRLNMITATATTIIRGRAIYFD